jgi:hypothetical protein
MTVYKVIGWFEVEIRADNKREAIRYAKANININEGDIKLKWVRTSEQE